MLRPATRNEINTGMKSNSPDRLAIPIKKSSSLNRPVTRNETNKRKKSNSLNRNDYSHNRSVSNKRHTSDLKLPSYT